MRSRLSGTTNGLYQNQRRDSTGDYNSIASLDAVEAVTGKYWNAADVLLYAELEGLIDDNGMTRDQEAQLCSNFRRACLLHLRN